MTEIKKAETAQLKKDFINLLESRREERELLADILNSFNLLAADQEEISVKIRDMKEAIIPDGEISLEQIQSLNRELKDSLLAKERESGVEQINETETLTHRFIESCRAMKKVMAAILEDFYPMSEDMKKAAESIRIECKGIPAEIEIKRPSEELLDFIEKIKIKISKDFAEINNTFMNLLGQVKELEKSLITDFSGDSNVKDMENFESDINQQVGNITKSFDSYSTIDEIKEAVIGKLIKIKDLVSIKKKQEKEKSAAAKESIERLNQRINLVEKKAQQISVKAREYQKAAMRDGLTGLFTRGAFDVKIKETFENYMTQKKGFSIIMFDVDKFKEINDKLGHIAGDKVLKKISECLEESFRRDDFIARYGGDEFIVIIEDMTDDMARQKIEVFNKNLKKRRFVSKKHGEIDLSVSAGAAKIMENDTVESLIDRADKIMYELKESWKRGIS
ncbi:MAG: GGDEF domain-containing protein [Deltaproteobacteria bacterium]|nr:GGDEF domain-containing protein [Deltaproteobacteria bacterium]